MENATALMGLLDKLGINLTTTGELTVTVMLAVQWMKVQFPMVTGVWTKVAVFVTAFLLSAAIYGFGNYGTLVASSIVVFIMSSGGKNLLNKFSRPSMKGSHSAKDKIAGGQ